MSLLLHLSSSAATVRFGTCKLTMSLLIKPSVMGAFVTSVAWSLADIGVNIWAGYNRGSSVTCVHMVLMSASLISAKLHNIILVMEPCADMLSSTQIPK